MTELKNMAVAKGTSPWCSILSTEGHQECEWRNCACLCHLPEDRAGIRRRPHSFPREKWEYMGANKRAEVWARLDLAHAEGLEHDRRVVALGALGAGLGVGVPGGDDDLVDL